MSQPILIKVYANVFPAPKELYEELRELSPLAISEEGEEFFFYENGIARISFEGLYFPLDEALEVIKKHLTPAMSGKIDLLDLEAWRLTRHFLRDGKIEVRSNNLNNVLDYSGH